MAGLLSGKKVCLDLDYTVRYKEKKSIVELVTNNGGVIHYTLNKKVTVAARFYLRNFSLHLSDSNESITSLMKNSFRLTSF